MSELGFAYRDRIALDRVTFDVAQAEIYGVLGPNGGGKTTLFRVLATLLEGYTGTVEMFGREIRGNQRAVRAALGVVFQTPSVDLKLTATENLRLHGNLYGIRGAALGTAIQDSLGRLGLGDRSDELVERLSGGLRRRVELARCLLSGPRVLLLDEPSTGLDPGARRDLWEHLLELRRRDGVTILVTTHLMEEAERCDRLLILDRGRVITKGSPEELRTRIGGDVVTIQTRTAPELASSIERLIGQRPVDLDGQLRLERSDGQELVKRLMESFPDSIDGITLARPTLEDVFIRETGHRFWNAD